MVTALAREYEPDKRVEDVEEPPFLPAAFEHELAFAPVPPFRPERLELDAESIAIGRVKTEDLIVHICLPETGEWHRLHPSTVKTACGLPVNYVRSATRDGRHAEHPLAPCDCWTRVEREEADAAYRQRFGEHALARLRGRASQ